MDIKRLPIAFFSKENHVTTHRGEGIVREPLSEQSGRTEKSVQVINVYIMQMCSLARCLRVELELVEFLKIFCILTITKYN